MEKRKGIQQILFSALGNTDPITEYHDGGCLHILRHYQPDGVVLFYTKEMLDKEKNVKQGHWYQESIEMLGRHLQCSFPILQTITTDIVNAHLMDEYIQVLPKAVYDLHEIYPEAMILLNLSSGTPQIKMILSLFAIDFDWCKGIQVAAPIKNDVTREVVHSKQAENNVAYDLETLFETDLDNEAGAVNRCEAPPLQVIRFFREKNQILSLIRQYEYRGAYALCRGSQNFSPVVRKLLKHAAYRQDLDLEAARKVLSKYNGIRLFPFDGIKGKLVEFCLVMQIHQKKHQLSELLVKIVPFMYEFLFDYVNSHATIRLKSYCLHTRAGAWKLLREKLDHNQRTRGLLQYLDQQFHPCYKDGEMSYFLLWTICGYLEKDSCVDDRPLHRRLMKELEQSKKLIELRNMAAHQIVNISEQDFRNLVGTSSAEIVDCFFRLLYLVYGDDVKVVRNIYDEVNIWIEKELDKGCDVSKHN